MPWLGNSKVCPNLRLVLLYHKDTISLEDKHRLMWVSWRQEKGPEEGACRLGVGKTIHLNSQRTGRVGGSCLTGGFSMKLIAVCLKKV